MNRTKLGEAMWTLHLNHVRALSQIVEASHARGESGMLLFLYHVGRPMYPGELTEKLGLTTGRIANILKVLEKADLVVRTPDRLDKRRVQVALTPRGEAVAERQSQEAIALHAQLISRLNEAEAQQFLDMLGRVIAVVETEDEKP